MLLPHYANANGTILLNKNIKFLCFFNWIILLSKKISLADKIISMMLCNDVCILGKINRGE